MQKSKNPHSGLEILNSSFLGSTYPYREAISSILYLMKGTSLDIANAIGKLAQFCKYPFKEHRKAVKNFAKRHSQYISARNNLLKN